VEAQTENPSILDLDPRVQFGLGGGLLMIAFGVLALPWVEFDQAFGGGTSLGFDELRRAFGAVDGADRYLGSLLVWIGAGAVGLGVGISSLLTQESIGSKGQDQFLPCIPLALCLVALWRINHYIAEAAGVFIRSGVDARLGMGGILAACGCAIVLGTVVWGHQVATKST